MTITIHIEDGDGAAGVVDTMVAAVITEATAAIAAVTMADTAIMEATEDIVADMVAIVEIMAVVVVTDKNI